MLHNSWRKDLNLLEQPRRATLWGWLIMGLGTLAILWAQEQLTIAQQAMEEAQQQSRRLQQAQRRWQLQQTASAHLSATAVAQDRRLLPVQLPAIIGMTRLLAYPWEAALDRIDHDAQAHQVVLLSLSVNLDEGIGKPTQAAVQAAWRLQAAVRGDVDALTWVEHLPHGQLVRREGLVQSFTSRWGSYAWMAEGSMLWPESVGMAEGADAVKWGVQP